MNVLKTANLFLREQNACEYTEFGTGHINSTFKITDTDKHEYILQHINKFVFKKPRELMYNLMQVTEFIRTKNPDPRSSLHFLKTSAGVPYTIDDDGEFWRMYAFVPDSVCYDRPTIEQFYECGLAFGKFQSNLCDFDASELFETIPDFHNTPIRYTALCNAFMNDAFGRATEVAEEIEFYNKHQKYYSLLIDANRDGRLPLRVSHNDTKCNNALLDSKTGKALCVIDLDTIMPGFSVTDFGDAIRFGASTAAEDEKDTSKIALDTDYFKSYTKGFLDGCGGKLPESELMLLYDGAVMMTLECGMRFLTDYLQGDVYFKTDYEGHNLVRARSQIALAKDMEKKRDEMMDFIKSLI